MLQASYFLDVAAIAIFIFFSWIWRGSVYSVAVYYWVYMKGRENLIIPYAQGLLKVLFNLIKQNIFQVIRRMSHLSGK